MEKDNTCAICLGNIIAGKGQALFTAECSHVFHFNCIAASVNHGNRVCPLCRSTWKDLPFQNPNITPLPYIPSPPPSPFHFTPSPHWYPFHHTPSSPFCEPEQFSDDEPVFQNGNNSQNSSPQVLCSSHQLVTIKAFPEFPAVKATDSPHAFSVLVGLRAPTLTEGATRAPIDLVVVLDVSGSMMGTKLTLLKRAVCFVINNLGPADRLSVVSFESSAQRMFPLRRMSNTGREDATLAVESLIAQGGTNIVEGLTKGIKVLDERRERNPVASILLFSDGQDTCTIAFNFDSTMSNGRTQHFLRLLPSSICPANGNSTGAARIPVHTFGIGSDHDPALMHAISDASGGTFSFIQDENIIQDAFARCIGGLLSVVSQKVRLTLTSLSFGVQIGTISSGKYSHQMSRSGESGVIDVGDIYADEQKDFLVQLSVPIYSGGDLNPITQLLKVECSYVDAVTKENVEVENYTVNVSRPQTLSAADRVVCLEVDRERNRLFVVQGIAEAQRMAETGNFESAQTILENRRLVLLRSSSSQAGDSLSKWLEAELKEIKERMRSHRAYQEEGRAYAFSGMSSHAMQRTTTRGAGSVMFGSSMQDAYETSSMAGMVERSRSTLPNDPHLNRARGIQGGAQKNEEGVGGHSS